LAGGSSRERPSALRPALPPFVRPGHAQPSAILDDARALPQGDWCVGPAFARGAESGERNLVVLDTGDMLDDAFPVSGPGIDAEGEVSSECAHVAPKICLVHWGILSPRKNRSALGSVAFFPGALLFWDHLLQSSSASRLTAGASEFFILSQSGERPER